VSAPSSTTTEWSPLHGANTRHTMRADIQPTRDTLPLDASAARTASCGRCPDADVLKCRGSETCPCGVSVVASVSQCIASGQHRENASRIGGLSRRRGAQAAFSGELVRLYAAANGRRAALVAASSPPLSCSELSWWRGQRRCRQRQQCGFSGQCLRGQHGGGLQTRRRPRHSRGGGAVCCAGGCGGAACGGGAVPADGS
jgi:hypothetical protein